ncbi:AraC family transcriptional regulator [Rhodoplanes elegans]|uniref:AraC family transcriptional regulator n=1 Tax=Rhodoplanes elegans TaxID=29408 RepID=A0A327KLG1_9BRAD|nr:helix-turn-helix domain-containing protein [Rhodoplanes elegans]MBK5959811.1 AraC family transcriptional regulator [Rhodoplanes elegans]RAI39700.1 AraC family transcriptional regulator [Rhodoplanes elegans]
MSERSSDPGRGESALQAMRAVTADICSVAPLGAPEEFQVSSVTAATGNGLLVESVSTALEYDRTPAHIARGGIDHFQITLCLRGGMHFTSGRREAVLGRGDVCLIDMAQPNRTVLSGGADGGATTRLVSIIVPRSVMAPRLAHPDSATASLLPGGGRAAQLLGSQLSALRDGPSPESRAAVEAMADIVAGAVGSAAEVDGAVDRADRHLVLAMIKRHIEAHLDTEPLTAEDLCRRFQMSRAGLYRLFEAEGGLARHVQEQRLNLALRRLAAPASRNRRLIDLALDLRFSGDSTFVRAFRRRFGLTPGEVRGLAEAWLRDTGAQPGPGDVLRHVGRG